MCLIPAVMITAVAIVEFMTPSREKIELAPPLASLLTSDGRETFIEAAPGVTLSELCDLSLFAGFWPEMELSAAIEHYGEPDIHYEERSRLDEVFGYRTDGAMVELVEQTVSSEGYEGERWLLRARPHAQRRLEEFLDRAVIDVLPKESREMSVYVNTGDGTANFVIEQGRVSVIWWLYQEEARRSP